MNNKLLISSVLSVSISLFSFHKLASKKDDVIPKYSLGLPFAIGEVPTNCDSIIQTAVAGEPVLGTYANHVLDHVHQQLYRFNKMESSDIEMVFCQLVNRMGMNPDLSKLPQSISANVTGGHIVSLDVQTPTEAFALALGYQARAVVKFDSSTFLTMWWVGNKDSSKGYLIQNLNPLNTSGQKQLRYAQWDRMAAVQSIKIFTTVFSTAYLTNPNYTNPVDPLKSGGDRAHFGRATYNPSSKAVTAQSVEIRQDRNNNNLFACYKMQIAGIIGGAISGYRPALGTPDSTADTNKDGTHIDGVTGITDKITTADGAGSVVTAPASLPQPFDYSCADIYNAGTSGVFLGNVVNFATLPSTVFPN